MPTKNQKFNLNRLIGKFRGNRWDLPDIKKLPNTNKTIPDNCKAPVEINQLQEVLDSYDINVEVIDYYLGSSITTFVLDIPPGFNLRRLESNTRNIARALKVPTIRINDNCHGSIGIEIENRYRLTVGYKDLIKNIPEDVVIPMILGEDTLGNYKYTDITDLPHLLIAGATGSGKSVYIHNIICTILATRTPQQVQFMMIDPKQVEFVKYKDIPHLVDQRTIAHEPDEAIETLNNITNIMDERYELFEEERASKLSEYREKTGKELPYIVVCVDEYADLMLMGTTKQRKSVEQKIARLALKARAAGIHLIVATQKPLVQVITSVIKANLQARAAFSVASATDSRVILDQSGAEELIGKGDMLFKNAQGNVTRIQTPWMPNHIIEYITKIK